MRKLWIAALVSAAASGCSTSLNSGFDMRQNIDLEQVGAVERVARRHGVEVHWVNPPAPRSTAR